MTPPTSDAIPLVAVFFSTQTVIVAISTAFTIVVLNLRYRQPTNHKMGKLFHKVFLVWLPWLLLMRRPEYKQLKTKAIKIRDKQLLEDECVQCIGIDVLEDGEAYVFKAAQQIFQPDPLFAKVYSMPAQRLGLERKVGEGIFPIRRCVTVKERRGHQYERYVQKCVDILSDPGKSFFL